MEEHNTMGADFLTFMSDEFSYLSIAKIENMADLDVNVFKGLTEKAGADKMEAIWKAFEPCYNSHGDYILHLDHALSYMPDGIDINPKGQPYRVLETWHVTPSNAKALADVGKEIKELMVSKGAPLHYRIYRSGFGQHGPYFMVATAAKDQADWEQKNKAQNEAVGEEGQALFDKALKLCLKYEKTQGWIRPDLSYKAKEAETAGNK